MTRPGVRLRAWLVRHCSEKTMRQCVDPAVADLQAEYRDARAAGCVWRSRWVRVAGYAAILVAAFACAWRASIDAMSQWPDGDRRAIGRAVSWSALTTIGIVVLATTMEFRKYTTVPGIDLAIGVYLVPQALAFAVPIGLSLGVPGVLSAQRFSARVLVTAVLLGAASAGVAVVNVGWLTPSANQAFREGIFMASGGEGLLPKGIGELTLNEVGQRGAEFHAVGRAPEARRFAINYFLRVGLALAPVPLLLFVLSIRTRTRARGVAAGAVTVVAWWTGVFGAAAIARSTTAPVVLVLMTPHALFALLGVWNLQRRAAA